MLEINKRSIGPEPLPPLLASNDVPWPLEHHGENLERLILQSDANAPLPQLARPEIDLKSRETPHVSGQYRRHVRIARWTFPIWMYVSVTGVIIYVLLYQIY